MEGLHCEFVQYSAEFVEMKWRPFYKAVLQHILETQFLEVESLDGCLWKALKGSGMGLGFSGELADITFYATVERAFVNDPTFLREHSVELYVRFKDDILVILGGTHASRISFFKSLRERSPVWKLEAESVDEFSCHFLDLTLAKGGRWKSTGLLDVGIYHKPTSLHQPLAPHSAHSAHVHLAWPKGMITRAKRLCNTRSMFHLEVLHLKLLNGCWLQGLAHPMQTNFETYSKTAALSSFPWMFNVKAYHSVPFSMGIVKIPIDFAESAKSLPCRLDSRHGSVHTNPSLIRTGCSPFTCTSC